MDYSAYRNALLEENSKKKKDDDLPVVEVARYDTGECIIVMRGRWKNGMVQDIQSFIEPKKAKV